MITATQGKSLSLAGLMFPYSGFKTLAKFSFQFADKGNYFPRIAGDMNCITSSDSRTAWTFATSTRELHHTCSNEFSESIKKGLMFDYIPVYGYRAPAKSGAGISLPEMYRATHDAPSVFFCVVSQPHTFFSTTGIIRFARKIMVGCAGASSEAPVSLYAGKANPAQSTTRQISLCGGGSKTQYKEAAICWLLPLPKIRNSFGLSPLFAAIVRQSSLFFTMLLLRLSVTLVVLWCVITSVSSLVVSLCRGRAMIKTYDLPIDPKERSATLISLALLMDEVLKGNADNRDEYLSALISLFEVYARDLHSLLEGHALPEVAQ